MECFVSDECCDGLGRWERSVDYFGCMSLKLFKECIVFKSIFWWSEDWREIMNG